MSKSKKDEKTPLSKGRILRTALGIVDERGISALSIRAVAEELGVYPTAVTWHTGSKANLVADVSALIFQDLELADDRSTTWDAWLRDTARGWRSQMHRHPNLAPVIGNQLTLSLPALPFVERVLRVLSDTGLRNSDLLHAYNTYVGCLVGWVSLELSHSPDPATVARKAYEASLGDIDPKLYTALSGNLASVDNKAFMVRWSNGVQSPMDDSFEHMLDTVLQGIQLQVAKEPS